jgi:GT2 family glycosyltransferase
MIPTYNCAGYLRRTLESMLVQDAGPDRMQIEVVDGCSTKDDPEAVVQELGKGRVAFFRLPKNQGPARTFNTCIERARGRWIHILHGDDMVLPGFYDAYQRVIDANPQVVMVVGQVVKIDEADRWLGLCGPAQTAEGDLLPDFVRLQTLNQLGQFVGTVVRRDIYEQVGGFSYLWTHVMDWDMWFRIGQRGPVACTPRAYGLYRTHAASDTNSMQITAANVRESYLMGQTNLLRLGSRMEAQEVARFRSRLAHAAESTAWRLDERGSLEGRLNQARWAWRLEPNWRRFVLVMKSWLKYRFFAGPSALPNPKPVTIKGQVPCS